MRGQAEIEENAKDEREGSDRTRKNSLARNVIATVEFRREGRAKEEGEVISNDT